MINVATRTSRLGTLVFKCTKKESRKYLLSQRRNTYASCTRGYVGTCNDKSSFSNNNLSKKTDLFVRNIYCSAQRQLSTEQWVTIFHSSHSLENNTLYENKWFNFKFVNKLLFVFFILSTWLLPTLWFFI